MSAFHLQPTEFEESVKAFNKAFNAYPKTREEMREHLQNLLDADSQDPLLDYAMGLQRMALFGLRLGLIIEETGEWCEAVLKERPKTEQALEAADLEYVLHGMNDAMGYDSDFARGFVAAKNHRKVLNKDKMKIGEGGKIIKPSDQ